MENVCEDDDIHLYCEDDGIIDIIEVWFGRRSATICPITAYETTDVYCATNPITSSQVAREVCQDETYCTLSAVKNDWPHDIDFNGNNPCPSTDKYLSVKYACVESKNPFPIMSQQHFYLLFKS